MAVNLVSISSACGLRFKTKSSLGIRKQARPKTPGLSVACVNNVTFKVTSCLTKATSAIETAPAIRRSGNYYPSIWDYNLLESLNSDFLGSALTRDQHERLKDDARGLLKEAAGPAVQLELISDIQRLGLDYQFENEIKEVLDTISSSCIKKVMYEGDLYTVALCFRLLRQNAYDISQDVFKAFMDEKNCFKAGLSSDIKGLLSLYEASYLSFQGEAVLDEARSFAIHNLKNAKGSIEGDLITKLVDHALELPLHWRMKRIEARWYIEEIYADKEDMNPTLLKLAKIDYNIVQAIYQEDIKSSIRWWRNLGLAKELPYTRDRLVECAIWAIGIVSNPHFRRSRQELTKVNQLISTVDDLYDVYGTLDEVEHFTDAIDRWNTNATGQLPDYMKICYLAVFNTVNELGYKILKEQNMDVIPTLKKSWTDLCKAYLKEAKWYHNGQHPTFDEYLDNGYVSISGHLLHSYGYVAMDDQMVTKEALQCIENKTDPLKWALVNFRLRNDWGTSKDELARGDVLKAVECYMHEKNVSEVIAREYISDLMNETWKKMNEDQAQPSPFPKHYMNALVDAIRIAQYYYSNKVDEFGSPNEKTKNQIMKLIVEPIPL